MNAVRASNSNSGKQLIEQTEVPGTPFKIIQHHETGATFIALGQYRLTEKNEPIQQLMQKIETLDWEFLTSVIGVIVEQTIQTYSNDENDRKTQTGAI